MKSAVAWFCSLGFAASFASGEWAPKTCGTSGRVFSSSVFAAATVPKSQPARVCGAPVAAGCWPEALRQPPRLQGSRPKGRGNAAAR